MATCLCRSQPVRLTMGPVKVASEASGAPLEACMRIANALCLTWPGSLIASMISF